MMHSYEGVHAVKSEEGEGEDEDGEGVHAEGEGEQAEGHDAEDDETRDSDATGSTGESASFNGDEEKPASALERV